MSRKSKIVKAGFGNEQEQRREEENDFSQGIKAKPARSDFRDCENGEARHPKSSPAPLACQETQDEKKAEESRLKKTG